MANEKDQKGRWTGGGGGEMSSFLNDCSTPASNITLLFSLSVEDIDVAFLFVCSYSNDESLDLTRTTLILLRLRAIVLFENAWLELETTLNTLFFLSLQSSERLYT